MEDIIGLQVPNVTEFHRHQRLYNDAKRLTAVTLVTVVALPQLTPYPRLHRSGLVDQNSMRNRLLSLNFHPLLQLFLNNRKIKVLEVVPPTFGWELGLFECQEKET